MARLLVRAIFFLLFAAGCVGFTKALGSVLSAPMDSWLEPPRRWIALGFLLYLPIHLIFRRLIVLHVFGHEITHALWSMLFGGKVQEIYISRHQGGYTTYSKGNFLVTLAPYFFPLYAMFFLLLHYIAAAPYKPALEGFIGAAISFHIFLTAYSIRLGQSDLKRAGVLMSLTFICMMNCVVLGLVFCVATGGSAVSFLREGATVYPAAWHFAVGRISLFF